MATEAQVKEAIKVKLMSGEYDQAKAQQVWGNYKNSLAQEAAPQPLVQQPAQQEVIQPATSPELTTGQKVLGALDAGGFILSRSVIDIGAGLTGLATGAVTGDHIKAADAVETVQGMMPDTPITEGGQQALNAVGSAIQGILNIVNLGTGAMAGLAEIVAGGGSYDSIKQARDTYASVQEIGLKKTVADRVFEETGNPEAATAALIAPDAILETIGLRGLKSFKRVPNELPINLKKALVAAAPDAQDIKAKATSLYKELDQMNIGIDQESYLNFAIKVRDKALDMGLDPGSDLTDKANHVLNRIDIELESGKPMTLSDMDRLRRVAAVAAGDINNKTNAAIGSEIINSIDDFIDTQAKRFETKGGPNAANKFNEARDLWSRYRKSEILDEVFNKADLAASGLENGLRNEFRSILKSKRKSRGFTPEELDAMRTIVKGTTLENTFSKLSNLGISPDQRRNFLGASIGAGGGAGIGTAVGGPVGGAIGFVAVPALGSFSAKMAQKMIMNNGEFASALVRSGKDGTKIAREYFKSVPVKDRNVRDLTELLMMSEGKVSNFGDAGMRKILKDAVFISGELKKAGQTSFMAAPLVTKQREEEN